MIGKEFDQWWTDFKFRFPDLGGPWFAEGRAESQQRVILGNFAEVLNDVSLSEALSVNRAMQRGDLEAFSGKWDRDEIARRVRTHVLAQRPAPANWTGPKDDPFPQPRDSQPVNLKGTLAELIDLKKRGASQGECDAFLKSRWPAKPASQQPRFKCTDCWDSGRLEVWHTELVFLAKTEGIESIATCKYRTTSAACTCRAGDQFVNRETPLVRFDLAKHCRVIHGDTTSEKAVSRLVEWLADQARAVNRANYTPAFAEYGG